MIYNLYKTPMSVVANGAYSTDAVVGKSISFLFDTNNQDYQTFKSEVNNDEAQIKDLNGNVMSPDEAKAYVATLP